MQIFGVLERYISKTIFTTVVMVLFILISLSGIIKFIDQLKRIGQGSYNALGAWIYILFSIPKDLQIFLPIAILLGVILGLGILTQYNELIIMQASGFSCIQILLSVMKVVILLILPAMIIDEWIVPKGEQIARNYRIQSIYGSSLFPVIHGVWIKDCNGFVYIRHIKCNNELNDISIYVFDKQYHLQSLCFAAIAKFDTDKKSWILSKVYKLNFKSPDQVSNLKTTSEIWKTNLTPDKLNLIILNYDVLSIRNLFHYIRYLKASGQDSGRQQLNLWNKVFQPLSIIIMALTAISFIFGPLNNVAMSTRIITGIIFGFIFYILNQILGPLALICNVSPVIGALLPNISFFTINLWLLIKYS